ncbi:peptide transporter family 2 isoform X2 [Tribolium castaneum]|uniref:peptide transporter family 2 isoform X2 n=1 Tax=Tribolium castaneum TaxID=7070 RepID=UPI0030FEC25E
MSDTEEKQKYPKQQIAAILTMTVFKKLCLVGIRTALYAYLENIAKYSKDDAEMVYNAFRSFNYCCPLLGALIADCFIGKFYTIVFFLIAYTIGTLVLSGSAVQFSEDISLPLFFFSLGLITLSVGVIKPCIAAFGGDQFKLPEQHKHLEHFFLLAYVAVNTGAAIGIYEAPNLRKMHCFGADSCYSAAFLLSTVSIIISLIVFVAAKRWYVCVKPQRYNTVLWVLCMLNGVKEKIVSKEKQEHWLDYSKKSYGESFVRQTKNTLKVVVIFTVLQFHGATVIITMTGWSTQSHFMRNEQGGRVFNPSTIRFLNYVAVILVTPILCLIVLFLRSKCHIRVTPLQRIACGAFIASVTMFVAAVLSLIIEAEVPNLPGQGECHIRFYNPLNCAVKIDAPPFIDKVQIDPMGYKFISVKVKGTKKLKHTISGCDKTISNTTGPFVVVEEVSLGYFTTTNGLQAFKEDLEKDADGDAKIRSLVGSLGKTDEKIKYGCANDHVIKIASQDYSVHKVDYGFYDIGGVKDAARFFRGGIYRVLLYFQDNKVGNVTFYEVGKPHQLHILWQIPQCVLHAISRVLSLKCTITAIGLMATGVGGIIVILIELMHLKQSHYYFTFGGFTMLFTLIFIFLAVRYRYVDQRYGKEENILTEDTESKDE